MFQCAVLSSYSRPARFLLLAIAVTALYACRPGMLDHTTPIIGDYRYVDTGGNGRVVARFEEGIGETVVIGARVDKIEVDGARILIARRPEIIVQRSQGLTSRLAPACEYWYIDVQTHQKGQFDPGDRWPTLMCRMTD